MRKLFAFSPINIPRRTDTRNHLLRAKLREYNKVFIENVLINVSSGVKYMLGDKKFCYDDEPADPFI